MAFYNYSAFMDTDIKTLEEKLSRLIQFCQKLRSENLELRQDLAQAQDENKQLKDNVMLAGNRLEALIESLPSGDAAANAVDKVAYE